VGENLFDGEAQSISLPGSEGRFEILALHEAFVSELKNGKARAVAADGSHHAFDIPTGGIAEVSHNQATVLL
jgi:F-type H+-transporting ATPase subunit epsilon